MAFFDRGDIVEIRLDRGSNGIVNEIMYCLVLSPYKFNTLGSTLVVPITTDENIDRFKGFAVDIEGSNPTTQGTLLVNGFKTVALTESNAEKIDEAHPRVVTESLAIFLAIMEA